MHRGRALLAVLTAVAASRTASGQVNVEGLRRDLRKAPAAASIAATFTGRTGNVESVEAGGNASGAARTGRSIFLGSTQADHGRFRGATTVSKSFIHARYNYGFESWLFGELFAQQQQDKFQRLLLRELLGGGPRFVPFDSDEARLALGVAAMLEYERIAVAEGAADEPRTLYARWSTYVSGVWQPDRRVRAIGTLYAQPRIAALGDVRVLLEATLQTQITSVVSVRIIGTVRHDSRPPTAVKPTDVEIKNAFALSF